MLPILCRTIHGAVSSHKQQSRYETVLAKRARRSKALFDHLARSTH